MATSPEVIAQQHEEARELLSIMEYAEPPSTEEIPLSMKTCPTVDLFAEAEAEEEKKSQDEKVLPVITSWSSRGRVDVTKLQALVREGYRISEHTTMTSAKEKVKNDSPNKTSAPYSANKKSKQSAAAAASASVAGTNKKKPNSNNSANSNNSGKPQPVFPPQYKAGDVKSPTNLWDPINASVNNVNIVRPSHDAWGIGKIVLLFADDFLKDVYEMPWWHLRSDLREACQPILDTLGISSQQQRQRVVVRLLLASLPPQTTIPLHQDSGAWVKQSHRVHVPIIVEHPDQVIFRVGLTDQTLQRIDCTPGHVFEMNNQCRHAVSNCSNDYRVHLILDYMDMDMDDHNKQGSSGSGSGRIRLNPGERLFQTRRSVDRLIDQGSRPTPSFLILGAQKAGTTSLYEYMMQHPLIIRPKRRETHCLDWRWKSELLPAVPSQNNNNNNNKKEYSDEEHRAHCQLFYETAALRLHPSCCTGDSTPSYLLDSRRVVPNLRRVFPWRIQFLALTRNPIQRAESHYAMVTSSEGTPAQLRTRGMEWRTKTFEQVVLEELRQMQSCGLIPYWNMEAGTCNQQQFDAFVDGPQEDRAWDCYLERHVKLNTGSYGLLARGLYALNLRPWLKVFDHDQFLLLSLEDDLNSECVRETMERVFDHVGVPSSFELHDVSPQNTRAYEPKMNADLFQMLQRFFEPHNQRWKHLLQTLPNSRNGYCS